MQWLLEGMEDIHRTTPAGQLPSSSYNHNTLTTLSEGVITNALECCSN